MNTHLLDELQARYDEMEVKYKELQHVNAALKESLSNHVSSYVFKSGGLITLTEDGLISEIDEIGAETFGEAREKLLQRSFSDFIATEDILRWQQILLDLIHKSKQHRFDLKLKHSNNSVFLAHLDCLRLEVEGKPISVQVTLHDIPERRHADRRYIENELRIAATVFESQVGMIVTDANEIILRVNSTFSKITGYSSEDAIGHTPRILSSGLQDKAYYAKMWETINSTGVWQGEILNQRKTGEVYPEFMTITAVTDHQGQVTNYVATLTDSARIKQLEVQRLADESAHRNTLIREVHHRIKNNLQGVTGVLRNFAARHPEFTDPIAGVISQVQSIAIIHGLQGRRSSMQVRLCELTSEIAVNNESLWNTPIQVDIPLNWIPCLVADTEAVPIALVLNELISNAIKHGDNTKGVNITIRHEPLPFMVRITITNHGELPPEFGNSPLQAIGTGLQLVSSLLPKKGAKLTLKNIGNMVSAQLELGPNTVTLEKEEMKKI